MKNQITYDSDDVRELIEADLKARGYILPENIPVPPGLDISFKAKVNDGGPTPYKSWEVPAGSPLAPAPSAAPPGVMFEAPSAPVGVQPAPAISGALPSTSLPSRVLAAPHATGEGAGYTPGAATGITPTGTIFTTLGQRTVTEGDAVDDGYPDLAQLTGTAPIMTSRPASGVDPRFNVVDIPDLDRVRPPRLREVGKQTGLVDQVSRADPFAGEGTPGPGPTGAYARPEGASTNFLDRFIGPDQ